MKTKALQLYGVLLAVIFAGVVIHAPLSVWLGTVFPEQELLIKSWKEILLVLLLPLGCWLAINSGLHKKLAKDMLVRLIVLYALLHLFLVAVFRLPLFATLAGLSIDLRYILFFALVYIVVSLLPEWRRTYLKIFFGMAALSLLFTLFQIFLLPRDFLAILGYSKDTIAPFLTVDNNPEYVRVNGTFRGPNPLGAYGIVVLGILSAASIRGHVVMRWAAQRAAAIGGSIAAAIAIYASYARSALGGAGIALAVVGIVGFGRRLRVRTWIAGGVAVVVIVLGGFLVLKDTSFVQHVLLHEDPNGKSLMSSNEGHVESLIDGTERMLRQPLGAGPGSTGSASLFSDKPVIIENQYLFVAHESGWLGLGIFVAIFAIILHRLWRRRKDWLALGVFASGCGLAAIGLLLPVWADDTVSIVWWGLAAIVLASPLKKGEYGRKSTN
ncbi:MAG TPA: O-antigen ligase family protein [Candidatus Saccharimonadales bacterium]